MEVSERIDQLCEYFQNQLIAIGQLSLPGSDDEHLSHYKKTLLLTLIDCMAGIRFKGEIKDNKKRFTRFVKEYGGWSDGILISTPFMVSTLKEKELEGPLLEKVSNRLNSFDPDAGNSITLGGIDFPPEELKPLVTCEEEKETIDYAQHFTLLYRYRNSLVHEFRKPGNGMEVFSDGSPCYHSYIGDDSYYLVYPMELFEEITKSAINGIETYFISLQEDPYDRVESTFRW
ncbi:hypothetical protein ACFL6P_07045 [Candidatus Latescibacterota bacterium]